MYLTHCDPKTREEKISFLNRHFRYHTMNSWNRNTSFAHCVKISNLNDLTNKQRNRCYDAVGCDHAYEVINFVLRDFSLNNPNWQIGFNGRSSGYLVLYHSSHLDRSLDSGEDYNEWDDEDINDRVALVIEFDNYCESAVAAFVEFAITHNFIEKEIMVPKKVIVAEPV